MYDLVDAWVGRIHKCVYIVTDSLTIPSKQKTKKYNHIRSFMMQTQTLHYTKPEHTDHIFTNTKRTQYIQYKTPESGGPCMGVCACVVCVRVCACQQCNKI